VTRPKAPQNVRLVNPDGEAMPVELVYAGVQDGIHHWVAVPTAPAFSLGDGWLLKVDVLPARTSIRLRVRAED
jgi:hypothetical protein